MNYIIILSCLIYRGVSTSRWLCTREKSALEKKGERADSLPDLSSALFVACMHSASDLLSLILQNFNIVREINQIY